MDETNKLQNRPEPATCHTSGSYINTVLMGNVELTDHEPATNAPGKSPYTTLMKNRDSSVYASLEPKVRDKNQVKAPENGIIPTTTTKQRNFFLKLLVFLIVLVLAVGILASVLVSSLISLSESSKNNWLFFTSACPNRRHLVHKF